ncbi:uncharacterized protein LOC120350286 [Nilaparvata lugens]|uniref:uncharacterized protein LOC120350286 n=1 Tax=Nilaparvata lugens TaxID=108931 RepID=UPI00193D05DA|nr:uncharacterized protein LOC120350286 [Nilaparvata lugens]
MLDNTLTSSENISFDTVGSANVESATGNLLDSNEDDFYESYGIKVLPSFLEFTAVFDGEKFSKEVVIRNISKKSVEIYLKQPISIAFQIIDNGTKISLAPGLSVKRTVVFQYRPDTLLSSFFTIRIKDALIEIPIFFKRVHTKFSVTPANLDFGKVDVGSPLVSKNVKMENLAAVAAQYKVVIGPNENHIQVIPSKGFIRPNETHMLRVQFYPTVPGQIYHVISVMPSSAKSQGDWRQKHDIFCTITLEADIIKPSLVAIHPNTTGEFTLCDFPLTFSSTTRYDTVAVCNTSAQYATFVVLGEMMNTLFELKSARKINSNYKMFSVQPTEGRIAPFEEIVLKIIYKPSIENEEKGWKYVEENCLQKSHFCFFKIVMVEVKDHIDFNGHEHTSKTDTSSSIDDEADVYNKDMLRSYDSANFSSSQGFRLCLHGLFTSPVLHVTPARLSFTGLRLGGGGDDSSRATVTVANRSLLSLGCRAVAQSYVRVTPALLFLEAGASVEIEVAVAAHAIGTFKRVVKLECLSMENVTDASGQKVIGETKFIVEGNVEVCTKRPQPKLNLGIAYINDLATVQCWKRIGQSPLFNYRVA